MPVLYEPTGREVHKMRNLKEAAAGRSIVDMDPEAKEKAFWVSLVRVNPMKKPGQKKVDLADWGDSDNPLMGPHGPSFIGRVVRDPVSAKVKLVYDGHNRYDFHAVDLWTRPVVEGSVEKLKRDKYLFKPVPMLYRTWLYHESYRNTRSHNTTSDDSGVIRQILSKDCIDADISAGRWSPLVPLLPAAFCCALTCDELSVGTAVLLAWLIQKVGNDLNKPERYKKLRLWLLLPRLAWVGFLIFRALSWLPEAAILNIVGLAGTLLFCCIDFLYGDRESANKYRLNCSYEVVKVLPNRVFVCRRVGATDFEKLFGYRGTVHQNISGIGSWGRNMTLIAELMGCIFELRPFTAKDWDVLMNEVPGADNARLCFWGMDCYDPLIPTWIDLNRKERVEAAALLSKVGVRHASGKVDADRLLQQLEVSKALFAREEAAAAQVVHASRNTPPGTPKDQGPLDDDVDFGSPTMRKTLPGQAPHLLT
ncbi:unnamed protein product [Symbiodinium sp. KB8]|nr:unnamed protein product [Symbiodinium sp. KB8]